MLSPEVLFKKAQHSKFHRWMLNLALNHMVPFNKPHRFKVLDLSDHEVTIFIPYRRSNFNHIKGLHATALATLSEFTTGLLLLNLLGTKGYRIILKRLDIMYHYQGKMNATANFRVNDEWLQKNVFTPLDLGDSTTVPCTISIIDVEGNKLTTATIYWQIKSWSKVKTKV